MKKCFSIRIFFLILQISVFSTLTHGQEAIQVPQGKNLALVASSSGSSNNRIDEYCIDD